MNNYVSINSKNYAALSADWTPRSMVAAQIKPTIGGRLDVIHGPVALRCFVGTLIVPAVAPDTGWGIIDDFRETYGANQSFTFVDHYGTEFTAIFSGNIDEKSLTSQWDANSNEFYVPVTIYLVS
jgi:hypothetical protein